MKMLAYAITLLLFCSSVSVAHEWEKLSDEKGNFKVTVPGKPNKLQQTVDTDVGKVEAHYYLVELDEGRVVYAMAYSDYPASFTDNADPETVLDGVRNGNIKPHDGTVTSEWKIKLENNFPGREYTFRGTLQGTTTPIVGYVRLYLVGTRLYQQIVLLDAKSSHEKENVGRFFYSLDRLKQ